MNLSTWNVFILQSLEQKPAFQETLPVGTSHLSCLPVAACPHTDAAAVTFCCSLSHSMSMGAKAPTITGVPEGLSFTLTIQPHMLTHSDSGSTLGSMSGAGFILTPNLSLILTWICNTTWMRNGPGPVPGLEPAQAPWPAFSMVVPLQRIWGRHLQQDLDEPQDWDMNQDVQCWYLRRGPRPGPGPAPGPAFNLMVTP